MSDEKSYHFLKNYNEALLCEVEMFLEIMIFHHMNNYDIVDFFYNSYCSKKRIREKNLIGSRNSHSRPTLTPSIVQKKLHNEK